MNNIFKVSALFFFIVKNESNEHAAIANFFIGKIK